MASPPAPGFLPLAGVDVMLYDPGREAAGCCGICVVLPPCAAEPMRRERVSRLPKAPSSARLGLDAGATGALHCAALEGGRTTPQQLAALTQRCQGRGERTSRQEEAGILGFRGRTGLQGAAAHSPASKRPIDLPQGAQRAAKSPMGGWRGERKQPHGQSAAPPVPSLCAPWGAEVGAQAQHPFERVCPHQGG